MRKPIAGRMPNADWTVEKSTLFAEIRRVSRLRLLLTMLLLLPILFWDTMPTALKSALYFRGPQDITAEELTAAADAKQALFPFSFDMNREASAEFGPSPALRRLGFRKNGSCYVRLPAAGWIETGLTVEEGLYTYSLARLGDGRLLLTRRSAMVSLDVQKGTIGYLPADVRDVAVKAVGGAADESLLLPLYMDATGQAFDGLKSEISFSIGLLLLWDIALFFAWRAFRHPERSEAYRVASYRAGAVQDTLRAMEEELLDSGVYVIGRTTVTRTWKLTRGLLSFRLEPRDFEKKSARQPAGGNA